MNTHCHPSDGFYSVYSGITSTFSHAPNFFMYKKSDGHHIHLTSAAYIYDYMEANVTLNIRLGGSLFMLYVSFFVVLKL